METGVDFIDEQDIEKLDQPAGDNELLESKQIEKLLEEDVSVCFTLFLCIFLTFHARKRFLQGNRYNFKNKQLSHKNKTY
ncbi:hypothetical protein OESDEN_17711 [Oesophagostomum dentatum]|uniref:Uncharacterized protein n=1 Tax=Oesophagostomum dentatum TaxID=61180 RepID=A0A0B1SHD7_OESDE|nr:hypothetical protein OESDEN_17711 [Oesophagostomum dentatum]